MLLLRQSLNSPSSCSLRVCQVADACCHAGRAPVGSVRHRVRRAATRSSRQVPCAACWRGRFFAARRASSARSERDTSRRDTRHAPRRGRRAVLERAATRGRATRTRGLARPLRRILRHRPRQRLILAVEPHPAHGPALGREVGVAPLGAADGTAHDVQHVARPARSPVLATRERARVDGRARRLALQRTSRRARAALRGNRAAGGRRRR